MSAQTALSAVGAAIVEIAETLDLIAPQHEGLRDYSRLNIQEATRREIMDALEDYERRRVLLEAAKAANQALVDDGHPDLPQREVSASALADLQDQLDTITAARALFQSNAATGLGLTAGQAEPK